MPGRVQHVCKGGGLLFGTVRFATAGVRGGAGFFPGVAEK